MRPDLLAAVPGMGLQKPKIPDMFPAVSLESGQGNKTCSSTSNIWITNWVLKSQSQQRRHTGNGPICPGSGTVVRFHKQSLGFLGARYGLEGNPAFPKSLKSHLTDFLNMNYLVSKPRDCPGKCFWAGTNPSSEVGTGIGRISSDIRQGYTGVHAGLDTSPQFLV